MKQRSYAAWKSEYRTKYVPAWEDERPTKTWIIEQFEAALREGKAEILDPVFLRKVEIWGRPWFVEVWEEFKAKGPDLSTRALDYNKPPSKGSYNEWIYLKLNRGNLQ